MHIPCHPDEYLFPSKLIRICALDGFGAEGDAERGIPPNATLEVTLEVPSWKAVEDVTGDKGVVKKTLVATSEWKVRYCHDASSYNP